MAAPRRLIATACLWFAVALAHAGSGLQTLRFERMGPEQLGVQTVAFAAQQDERGLIWLGTADGLLRYDGRGGRLFGSEPGDPKTLRHPHVWSLLRLPGERLLVGTNLGLDEFDIRTETARRHGLPDQREARASRVVGLLPAGAGQVWVQTPADLLLFDTERRSFAPVALPDLIAQHAGRPPAIIAMAADGQGGAWVLAGIELVHVDAGGRLQQRWPVGPLGAGEHLRSLALDREGRAWIGGERGVRVLDLRDGRSLAMPRVLGLPAITVHKLLRDSEGAIWIGYGGAGLWRWRMGDARAEAHVHHPALGDSLANNAIALLFEDRAGVLWVGHWGAGLSLADPKSGGFRSYRAVVGEPDSLASDAVMAVQADGADHAWVATYGKGLGRLNLRDGTAEQVSLETLPMAYQKALLLQPGRGLWIGGDAGLFLLEAPAHPTRRARAIELGEKVGGGRSISALVAAPDGRVWAASAAGVYRLDPDRPPRRYRHRAGDAGGSGLSHEVVDCLLLDRAGRLWAGSKGGLHLYDAQRDDFVQPVAPSADAERPAELGIQSLREDALGRIWVGTHQGLYELIAAPRRAGPPMGTWQLRSWRHLPGMPSGWIHSLENARDGALWMASSDGLSRLDPERRRLRHYAARRGYFPGNFGLGASTVGADGSLFYGGTGVLRFDPTALRDNATPPSLALADIRVFNRSLLDKADEPLPPGDAASTLEALGIRGPLARAESALLTHREAMISFDLRALHFYSPRLIRYAWRLDGFDADWIHGPPGEGLATYTNLDPGRYRLLARAANPDGVWGEPRQLLEIEMLPPWWRSAWFRALALAALVLSVMAVWHLRLRRLERDRARLEAKVARRTAEVQAQRQQIATLSEIGRELTASLDLDAIRRALFGHVEALMPALVFGVGLVRADERVVEFDYMVERGRLFKPYRRSLDAPEQPAARCVASGEPLLIREFEHDNTLVDATLRGHSGQRLELVDGGDPTPARSGVYVPLKLKGQVIGVLAVLSDRPGAYQQTHLDMLTTLGAYAAVALDNADAYLRLRQARERLVAQEKLASLGSLVAGVAHELNTPIGNGLLAASTLQDGGRRLAAGLASGQLRRSELQGFSESLAAGTDLLVRSLSAAADLVASFKQLAVDQASERRRAFELLTLCEEVRLSHLNRLRQDGHEFRIEVPQDLALDSYPGPLGQVLGHLLQNAIVHGLEGRHGGVIRLTAEAVGADRVRITFADDGRGIAPAHLSRVFDPFFTTRLGSGGNGLGLHLCYTIVDSLLGGEITATSEEGAGAVFVIVLPKVAPAAAG